MNQFEVKEPILNSPFEEPQEHWWIEEGKEASRRAGRRKAMYFYRPPTKGFEAEQEEGAGTAIELLIVNLIRARVKSWREQGYPGVTRTTLELLQYWRREGRRQRLFFAQVEAVETILFLTEARSDLRQGIEIPWDNPSADRQAEGLRAFRRYACKMATGSGKTTVMGMLAAWSILNKVNDRSDARFSDAVLVVCPNVTIRSRLRELDPGLGEASLYRTRELVPAHLIASLAQGKLVVTNWHVFEPQVTQVAGVSARVNKAGKPVRTVETLTIGAKTTTARGSRYITLEDLKRQVAAEMLNVMEEVTDKLGNLTKVKVESWRYVESDTALIERVLGRDIGGKQNLLVLNDEAHHAYRVQPRPVDEYEDEDDDEYEEEIEREATVWIEGLDRIHKLRGINVCVDLSATPYYLTTAGSQANRPFPWIVSDFGLTDAIESGLVKIPQLAVRDPSGASIPGYFNIWRWILERLTTSERGGKRASVKPEAILKYAHSPIAMLGGLWEELRKEWEQDASKGGRSPVYILVCKNTKIAKVVHEWLAEGKCPPGIPPARIEGFRNKEGRINTIRVDFKVVSETDTGEAKNDEVAWMRATLDSVGRSDWPKDSQGRALLPQAFEELAKKLGRPLHPPGRDVRCIISVGMLTEGWDCNTVTHVIGLRPFMSQLLCEQVVGRALRRANYEVGPDGKLREEVAKILGVPFEIVPFKESKGGAAPPPEKRYHVQAIAEKARFEIRFPRVEGYQQAVKNRIAVDWASVPELRLDPTSIPPEIDMKGLLANNQGRISLVGPGKLESVTLSPYRAKLRKQQVAFELASALARDIGTRRSCAVPMHALFPQLLAIVTRYLDQKVLPVKPAELVDVALSPYFGWVIEKLQEAIHPDASQGEVPEVPRYEANRGPGSTCEVDFWTSRDVREVVRSHLNYVVPDTKKWEQSAAYFLDKHPKVEAFVKNAGLGFTIPYLFNGEPHDYEPDFIARMKHASALHLILETKGYDPRKQEKVAAAERWVRAVNAEGSFGTWAYRLAGSPEEVPKILDAIG
jgi:type III restriction enzyme